MSKPYVDASMIVFILRDFMKTVKPEMVISVEITHRGEVILHTNRPGILIGRGGIDIDRLRKEIKRCGATKVTVKEMKCVVSNCGVY